MNIEWAIILRSIKFTMFSPQPVNFQLHVKGLGVDDLLIIIDFLLVHAEVATFSRGETISNTMKEMHRNLE